MHFKEYSSLLVAHQEAIVTVTLNRPAALNALSSEVIDELDHVLDILAAVNTGGKWPFRGMIITGAGEKAFAAGADIREMTDMSPDQAWAYSTRMQSLTLKLESLHVPVIAAVNGFALGGGCELAMACDFIYATTRATFGQPEVSLGLVPGFGGSVRMQQRVGPARARELLYTGQLIKADEAHWVGLVNALFDSQEELLGGARSTLLRIAGQSPTAVAAVKSTMRQVEGHDTARGLEIEAEAFREAFRTADMQEGTRAFLAKEKPAFPGR
ncbi:MULTISPECIES: enoyl-CoA hydratase/isomerase family protein [unclassified Arthrobacter]|uniref:enoyl-CoA hydratase/isomerase family protein n=1 Tax=unclassified Arthrobacter TaxID=235627 RepID=UPI001491F19D|nr:MULTISPECIES: enoyl-CoA hydratase-related protein [unclassified Arthrobacter]MBE0008452.1 enoyl-CoA hydratase [Arthrobacter sp. AET 35A]NOJ62192.1 enoyl-CoA hydratase [Arthrobacter sp. 147(2020)]